MLDDAFLVEIRYGMRVRDDECGELVSVRCVCTYCRYIHHNTTSCITSSPYPSTPENAQTPRQMHNNTSLPIFASPSPRGFSCTFSSLRLNYPNHTHQNSKTSAAKNATHAFHPTPVFFAILSILFIVPLILFLLFSNWSFIFSASVVESRISSPMRWVS